MRRKLAAGNWKMNGTRAALGELDAMAQVADGPAEVLICPPASLISAAADRAPASVKIGAQDCHENSSGAHTGNLSAEMLSEAGATHVILGHSERRADHGETDALVCAKTKAAQASGLVAIVCIGETLQERNAGDTLAVVTRQLAGSVPEGQTGDMLVVAYEPVWAIGTGLVPTLEQIAEVHNTLRSALCDRFASQGDTIRLLYGGSVKASNAADIFATPDVDGALVGGASLKAQDFVPIVTALCVA
jgi:triosephosphate isomerase